MIRCLLMGQLSPRQYCRRLPSVDQGGNSWALQKKYKLELKVPFQARDEVERGEGYFPEEGGILKITSKECRPI